MSPSTVPSAQVRRRLIVWSTCYMEMAPKKIYTVYDNDKSKECVKKVHKGVLRVGFWVGDCACFGSADARTGWNSVSRIYVEEVPRPQA